MKDGIRFFAGVFAFFAVFWAGAEENFQSIVGPVKIGEVTQLSPLTVPYITWGGDVATFYANGGLTTRKDSIYSKLGLNLKLMPGDNFVQQVRNYMEGKTPFLRGTFHMIGLASELIGNDPRTKGVVIMQMTWSAGDHCVARKEIKTVKDLKGKTVALQKCGPHIGMLDDVLKTAGLGWNEIKIVWADDLTGSAKSPAEMFRKNSSVDACFVISPDMIGLTGGLQNTGSGAEGTVAGARVLVSTAELSRSIADVYVCRKDFYDSHREIVSKFVAGYLKACEDVVDMKKQYESKGSQAYIDMLKMAQDIYGKDTIPTLEEDAHGLICDCTFVGYPGNLAFFNQKDNLHGFESFQKSALDLATGHGYAKIRCGLIPSSLEWNSSLFTGLLTKTQSDKKDRFRAEAVIDEIESLSSGGKLDDRTIYSFTINFKPNQSDFTAVEYGADFQKVMELADKYGNAVIAIRGHADPTKTLVDLINAGMKKGILSRTGSKSAGYKYSLNGKPLDMSDTKKVCEMIEKGDFDGVTDANPREVMQAALNLSRKRAESVRNSIIEYSAGKGVEIDKTQVQPLGVGIREPFIAKPSNMAEAEQNMRVEFRILRVAAEAMQQSDFDY